MSATIPGDTLRSAGLSGKGDGSLFLTERSSAMSVGGLRSRSRSR